MSFRCSKCNVAYPNEMSLDEVRPSRVVYQARPRQYGLPQGAGIALGWEIASEVDLCQACLKFYQAPTIDLSALEESVVASS